MAIAASILLQISAVYVPFMQSALGTAPLSPIDWLYIFLVSSTILVVDEIRKLIQRNLEKKIIWEMTGLELAKTRVRGKIDASQMRA